MGWDNVIEGEGLNGHHLIHERFEAPLQSGSQRLDKVLCGWLPSYSREQIQRWIRDGSVTVDGVQSRASALIRGGERIDVRVQETPPENWQVAQAVPFDVIAETADYLVLNKPQGVVVHPGAGQPDHTLVNGLLLRFPEQHLLPRAGIVHRLDKQTSGLMVVARNLECHTALVRAMARREVQRRYLLIVKGRLRAPQQVDQPIGRHRLQRTRMTVVAAGKAAKTDLFPLDQQGDYALLRAQLHTGRTHQIRVHCAYLKLPIIGDTEYGVSAPAATQLNRQALHAKYLQFVEPRTQNLVRFVAPLPDDFTKAMQVLGLRLRDSGDD